MSRKPHTHDEALGMFAQWTAKDAAKSVGLVGNAADIFGERVTRMKSGGMRPDSVTDQTSSHDPLNGYLLQDYRIQ